MVARSPSRPPCPGVRRARRPRNSGAVLRANCPSGLARHSVIIRGMRPLIIAANWKMNTTPADAGELAATIAARTKEAGVIRVICPPFVCLAAVRDALKGRDVAVGAQNVHHEQAAPIRRDLGGYAERTRDMGDPGHSERRRDAGETDELIGKKLARAVASGLRPIMCVASCSPSASPAARSRSWPPSSRAPSRARTTRNCSGRLRHRVRAGLGDRHGQDRLERRRGRHGRRHPQDPRRRSRLGQGRGERPRPVRRQRDERNIADSCVNPRSTVVSSARFAQARRDGRHGCPGRASGPNARRGRGSPMTAPGVSPARSCRATGLVRSSWSSSTALASAQTGGRRHRPREDAELARLSRALATLQA